jgi:hypothetical protein
MPKIGIICGIGPLDSYGYQYNYRTILKNFASLAHSVYLPSTTRMNSTLKDLDIADNVKLLSNQQTWFDLDDHGNEMFSMAKSINSVNYGLMQMRKDGCDIAINLCVNQYIPPNAWGYLEQISEDLARNNYPYSWLYKKYLIAGQMFHSDIRLPWIINLKYTPNLFSAPDSITDAQGKTLRTIQTGDYRKFDDRAIVDIQFELTKKDLEEKVNFTSNYVDLYSTKGITVKPYFVEDEHLKLYQSKVNKKIFSGEQLDEIGKCILSNNQTDFLGWGLLQNYCKPSLSRQLYRKLQYVSQRLIDRNA